MYDDISEKENNSLFILLGAIMNPKSDGYYSSEELTKIDILQG
ncbi:hypothetical protein [Neobacillus niacini]|nr:hypothetical protein [Neobacillus niacini]